MVYSNDGPIYSVLSGGKCGESCTFVCDWIDDLAGMWIQQSTCGIPNCSCTYPPINCTYGGQTTTVECTYYEPAP